MPLKKKPAKKTKSIKKKPKFYPAKKTEVVEKQAVIDKCIAKLIAARSCGMRLRTSTLTSRMNSELGSKVK